MSKIGCVETKEWTEVCMFSTKPDVKIWRESRYFGICKWIWSEDVVRGWRQKHTNSPDQAHPAIFHSGINNIMLCARVLWASDELRYSSPHSSQLSPSLVPSWFSNNQFESPGNNLQAPVKTSCRICTFRELWVGYRGDQYKVGWLRK